MREHLEGVGMLLQVLVALQGLSSQQTPFPCWTWDLGPGHTYLFRGAWFHHQQGSRAVGREGSATVVSLIQREREWKDLEREREWKDLGKRHSEPSMCFLGKPHGIGFLDYRMGTWEIVMRFTSGNRKAHNPMPNAE